MKTNTHTHTHAQIKNLHIHIAKQSPQSTEQQPYTEWSLVEVRKEKIK